MRIIAPKTLKEFWERKPDCEQALKTWFRETTKARWQNPSDIKSEYATASILRNNRVVFNIHGNKYRLVVRINYEFSIVWIRFIGTHSEYDKIDAANH